MLLMAAVLPEDRVANAQNSLHFSLLTGICPPETG